MAQGGLAAGEVRKKITAVFADLAGSTTLAERLDPELFRQVVSDFFERAGAVITRHGGTVENFVGDEVAGVFGAPVAHGDDALRAVRAAEEMLRELAALNDELEPRLGTRLGVRVGVNTGTVVIGPPIAGRAMALGDAMNVAARLEKRAGVGEVLLGEETYRLVRREVTAEPAGELELRGRREPIAAYRLIAATAEPPEPLADRPLVGRDRELMLLNVAFERAVARNAPELVTVMGEAGIGKSRLVAELAERYRASATLLVGRCLPYGEGITYWALAEVIEQAAEIDDGDDASGARRKLTSLIGEEDGELVTELAQIAGLDDSDAPADPAGSARRLFELLSARRPLIVVFEDLHWAEPALLELILRVARESEPRPLLVACTARFELTQRRPEWRHECPTTISLAPLRDASVGELVGALAGAGLDGPARERIVELAAGNPLFVEQVLSMLIDDGVLRRAGEGWEAAGEVGELAVPPSIEAILASRIDHLEAGERRFLEAAAVIGKEFSGISAAALAGEPEGTHEPELERKQLIERVRRPGTAPGTYRFRHMLLRDAVYESLARSRRAELHERFAARLTAWDPSRIGQVEEIIAYHLETAHRCLRELMRTAAASELAQRAAHHLQRAGERAARRRDDDAAARLEARAQALLAEVGAA